MRKNFLLAFSVAALLVTGCAEKYSLVPAGSVAVAKGELVVQPPRPWNRIPKGPGQAAFEERWTQNGPLLDTMSFFGGVPNGGALLKQSKKATQRVPVFRENMTPRDIVSELETLYRIRMDASNFEVTSVSPRQFLGQNGFQIDFAYTTGDNLRKLGRAVGTVRAGKLYLIDLDGAEDVYFPAALPDFEEMTARAAIR